jgi:rod shape-determining protein MreC
LLNFQQHYIATTVAAQVIGTSGSDLSRVLSIDKGANDGLKPDMAVITPDGIVGKLRDVFPDTSQVLEINDQTSGAGVLLATTRTRAILRGSTTGHIQITNLTPDARIKPGEKVLTSGGDQIYPHGLPVGTIESVVVDPDHQPYTIIRLQPAANLNQLEEVLIITGTQTGLPPQAKKDLAIGATTAEAQAAAAKQLADQEAAEAAAKSAAQIVADRLPSLQEDTPPAAVPGAATPPKPPGGVVPRPLPTLHPDRYTPGSTPPATALKPGAENNDQNSPAFTTTPPASTETSPAPAPKKTPKSPPPPPETQP